MLLIDVCCLDTGLSSIGIKTLHAVGRLWGYIYLLIYTPFSRRLRTLCRYWIPAVHRPVWSYFSMMLIFVVSLRFSLSAYVWEFVYWAIHWLRNSLWNHALLLKLRDWFCAIFYWILVIPREWIICCQQLFMSCGCDFRLSWDSSYC